MIQIKPVVLPWLLSLLVCNLCYVSGSSISYGFEKNTNYKEDITRSLARKAKIKDKTYTVLQFLTQIHRGEIQAESLEADQKRQISEFFHYLWVKESSNKKILNFRKLIKDTDNLVVDPVVVDLAGQYSYKIRKNYDKLANKIQIISRKLRDFEFIDKDEKLSVRQLRQLSSLANMERIYRQIDQWNLTGLLSTDEKFKTIKNLVVQSKELHDFLLNQAQEESPYTGVAVIAYDFKNDFAYRKTSGTTLFFIKCLAKAFQVKIDHLSVSFQEAQEIYEAHMWGKPSVYSVGPKPLASYLYHSYKIRLDRLIAENQYSRISGELKMLLGQDWHTELDHMFGEIVRNYFITENKDKFSKLYNPELRRLKSIFAMNFTFKKDNIDQKMQFSPSGMVTCSEFVAKAILQCVDILNERLREKWEQLGMSPVTAPKLLFPLKEHRLIKRYSPQEWMDLMIKHNIVSLIFPPKIIKAVIRVK